MEGEKVLYEYLYQSIMTQIYSGCIRYGQQLPSQKEICRQYNVGITTVRKVVRMLEKDGFIETAKRKRPVVVYKAENQTYVSVLLQRKDIILDIYRAMGLLMPVLHSGGAMRYGNFKKLQAIIDSVDEDMDQRELFMQSSRFLLELLTPYNNQVLFDLQTDSENYTHVPYLPISGLKDQYSIMSKQVKDSLTGLLGMIYEKKYSALLPNLQRIFDRGYDRTKRYLDELEACYHSSETKYSYHWVMGKNRAHLYTVIARQLYRRILSGEFNECKYIPSVTEIMKEYSISQATALNAVALLNDIGAVRTLDKKGTVIAKPGERLLPLRMDRAAIGDNLVLFLDALQILTVCSGSLAHMILSGMDDNACQCAVEKWDRENPKTSSAVVRLLLSIFKDNAPGVCLKSFFEQLDYLLIWGHYMERDWTPMISVDDKAAEHILAIRKALAEKNAEVFANRIHSIFHLSYAAARQQMIIYGTAPDKLPAPLNEFGIAQ